MPPTDVEIEGWGALPGGAEELAVHGARPSDPRAADDFHLRTTAEPAVTVHGIESGSPRLQKTVLPVEAIANVSIRLAPGQTTAAIAPVFERMLRDAAPEGADVEIELWSTGEPGYVDPESPAVLTALDAFEHTVGIRPVVVRTGGSIPVVAALTARGVPAIVTVEEHSVVGGLGSAVAEYLAESDLLDGRKFRRVGFPGVFPAGYGDQAGMMRRYGITAEAVAGLVRQLLAAPAAKCLTGLSRSGQWPAFEKTH